MINVIFTYKATAQLPNELQQIVDQVKFIEIPEMKRIEEVVNENLTLVTIPYQANLTELEFHSLSVELAKYGLLTIVGKWDEQGEIIEFDLQKYCDVLKPIKTFEKAVFINGEDYTGREEEFQPVQKKDENDELVFVNDEPVYEQSIFKRFTREIESTQPTLEQAKEIHVNVFDRAFKRKLI